MANAIKQQAPFKELGIPQKELECFPAIDLMMGLEVELENCVLASNVKSLMYDGLIDSARPATTVFRALEDGSLRNQGVEFVSKRGFTGQEILWGLKELLTPKQIFLSQPSAGFRTSIHVHLNLMGLTFGQVKKLLFWYTVFEPIFFALSGDRSRSIFCVPLSRSSISLDGLFNRANHAQKFDFQVGFWHKYCALNLIPMKKYGSIEFRHHVGTTDYNEIESWMVFLWQFFEAATGSVEESLNDSYTLMFEAWKSHRLDKLLETRFGLVCQDMEKLEAHIEHAVLQMIDRERLMSPDVLSADPNYGPKKQSSKSKVTFATLTDPAVPVWTIFDDNVIPVTATTQNVV